MNIKQTINVETEKQLFIDNCWFETSHGMTLRVNPPIKVEQVLTAKMPWETKGILPVLLFWSIWVNTGYGIIQVQRTSRDSNITFDVKLNKPSQDGLYIDIGQ
jgi:hypothetical protein